jgi:uncharacterized protein
MLQKPMSSPHPSATWVVLDTNVVLDLLVFHDVRSQGLHQALQAGRLQPLATAPMFDELADVLSRPFLARWQVDAPVVLAQARLLCQQVEAPPPGTSSSPRCADPDDQIFIDLAWSWPARWLFSRDRALLDLARAAHPRGLDVLTPAAWAARPALIDTTADQDP